MRGGVAVPLLDFARVELRYRYVDLLAAGFEAAGVRIDVDASAHEVGLGLRLYF